MNAPKVTVIIIAFGILTGCFAEKRPNLQTGYYQNQFDEWLPRAEGGFAPAQYKVGTFYQIGAGATVDLPEASKWYRRAAQQGHARAQYSLALLLGAGRGVSRDYEQAYIWYSLAAARLPEGNERKNASSMQIALERYMTREQLFKAQEIARNWTPQKEDNSRPATRASSPEQSQQGSSGSAFIVSSAGHIITNNHLVDDCRNIFVNVEGQPVSVDLIAQDEKNDIALLKFDRKNLGIAKFRSGRGVRSGDTVVVVGFPLRGLLASTASVTTGTISALAGPQDDARILQITAPVQPGNSGGPILDKSGNVVGIVYSKLDAITVAGATGDIPQNVNFGLNARIAQSFVEAHDVDYKMASSIRSVDVADIADQAKQFTVAISCTN